MADKPKPEKIVDVHIDRRPYQVDHKNYSGLALRELAGLQADVDLYLEEHGDTEDTLIGDDQSISLKAGQHFYSTPRHITPGHV